MMKTDRHHRFATWLTNEMDDRGISQSELGRLLGLPQGSIHHWTSGRNLPRPYFCNAIADALNIDLARHCPSDAPDSRQTNDDPRFDSTYDGWRIDQDRARQNDCGSRVGDSVADAVEGGATRGQFRRVRVQPC